MQSSSVSDNKLQQLKLELDGWRAQQSGRKPIPQYLWNKAFALLNSYWVGAVSRELRLDHSKLKKHLLSSNNVNQKSSQPPQFLEFAASELAKSPAATTLPAEAIILSQSREACRVIFERTDGSRLIVQLPMDWSKIETICNDFLRG
jgi:hypothetical protein